MADASDKWDENVPGKIYVDKSCISCDACVCAAPHNFEIDEDDGHAFVKKQPTTPEEELACKEAIDGCPVMAIGNDGEELTLKETPGESAAVSITNADK